MAGSRLQLLVDTTHRLMRRRAITRLKRIVHKSHPADLAALWLTFEGKQRLEFFNLIEDKEVQAQVLTEVGNEEAASFLMELPIERQLELLQEMESDDAADIIGAMPEEHGIKLLDLMKKDESLEVEGLLKYDEETAGGIMTPDFIALNESTTAQEAIDTVRANSDVEMAFYLYVVNDHQQLVGVLSLRQLVLVPPNTILKDIMETAVVSVKEYTDQEEVARLVAKYNLLAIPVVDDNNVLLGIVTVDDVIDVIREEATEDILKMAGAGQEMVESSNVARSIKARFPWLLVSCIGELIGAALVSPFLSGLKTHYYLAAFMPIIMAMGGNIGNQSATVIVRGLATGAIDPKKVASLYWRELRVALLLGLVYGAGVGLVSFAFSGGVVVYGAAVALSMCVAMAFAVTIGTLLPLVFARINIDPAVATGPFISSTVDVLGLLAYFSISTFLLAWLL